MNFSYKKRALPVLTFKYTDGTYIKAKVENGKFLFKIEPNKEMSLRMVGFKDTSLYYPVTIKSTQLEIKTFDKDKGLYKLKLLEDTANVDCMIDCNYWWLNIWENSGDENSKPNIYECKNSVHIASVKFIK